jgi:hypothetical protein
MRLYPLENLEKEIKRFEHLSFPKRKLTSRTQKSGKARARQARGFSGHMKELQRLCAKVLRQTPYEGHTVGVKQGQALPSPLRMRDPCSHK